MLKLSKSFYKKLFIAIVLVFFAVLCQQLRNCFDQSERVQETIFNLTRSCIYICLYAAWGMSVHRRIVAARVRRYLVEVALLLVFWMFIRTIKYYFVADLNIARYLWYMYYIPMLFVPVIAVKNAMSLVKPESYIPPGWLRLLSVISGLLVLLVLTNDLHQLVFGFPKDAVVYSDFDYFYRPGYLLIMIWEISCAVASFIIMLSKCRIPYSKAVLWMPFVPIVVAIVYGISYALRLPLVTKFLSDLTAFQCLIFTACFEGCIQCGLIQSNSNYEKLFRSSRVSVFLTDQENQVYLASEGTKIPSVEKRLEAKKAPAMLGKKHRLSCNAIHGGNVYWVEDVSRIMNAVEEIRDLNEFLEESYATRQEEARTEKQKLHLKEANRLYNQMQMETAGHLKQMQQLIKELSESDTVEVQREIVWKLSVLGAYFKRRNNLLFLAETQETIRQAELEYCLKESMGALELAGVKCSYQVSLNEELSLFDMMRMYDSFEMVVEQTFENLQAIAVYVMQEENLLKMLLTVHVENGLHLLSNELFEIEEEDENEYLIEYKIERTVSRNGLLGNK